MEENPTDVGEGHLIEGFLHILHVGPEQTAGDAGKQPPVSRLSALHHLSSVPKPQLRVRTASAHLKSRRPSSPPIGILHSSLLSSVEDD